MMRNIIVIVLVVLCSINVWSQNNVTSQKEGEVIINNVKEIKRFDIVYRLNGTNKQNGTKLVVGSIRTVYTAWWRLGIVGELGNCIALSEKNGDKHWEEAAELGGGLHMYAWISDYDEHRKRYVLDVAATMGSSVGKTDWGYTYYDLGLTYSLGSLHSSYGVSVGYRHCNSHLSSFGNYDFLYAGVVIRI